MKKFVSADAAITALVKHTPKMLKGAKGWYFKFGKAVNTAGESVELFIKMSFSAAPYVNEDQNTLEIVWAKANILWVGNQEGPDIPDLENDWVPQRTGKYMDGDTAKIGVLLGAVHMPMGSFANIFDRVNWLIANADAIEKYLTDTLLSSFDGSIETPFSQLMPLICDTSAFVQYEVQGFNPMLTPAYGKYVKTAIGGVKKYDPPKNGADGDDDLSY